MLMSIGMHHSTRSIAIHTEGEHDRSPAGNMTALCKLHANGTLVGSCMEDSNKGDNKVQGSMLHSAKSVIAIHTRDVLACHFLSFYM